VFHTEKYTSLFDEQKVEVSHPLYGDQFGLPTKVGEAETKADADRIVKSLEMKNPTNQYSVNPKLSSETDRSFFNKFFLLGAFAKNTWIWRFSLVMGVTFGVLCATLGPLKMVLAYMTKV